MTVVRFGDRDRGRGVEPAAALDEHLFVPLAYQAQKGAERVAVDRLGGEAAFGARQQFETARMLGDVAFEGGGVERRELLQGLEHATLGLEPERRGERRIDKIEVDQQGMPVADGGAQVREVAGDERRADATGGTDHRHEATALGGAGASAVPLGGVAQRHQQLGERGRRRQQVDRPGAQRSPVRLGALQRPADDHRRPLSRIHGGERIEIGEILVITGEDERRDVRTAIRGGRERIDQGTRRGGDEARRTPRGLVAQRGDEGPDGGGVGSCDQDVGRWAQVDGRHWRISVGETPKLSAGWMDDTGSGS